jgi:hypothetical protein
MRWLVLCSALIPLALSPFGFAHASFVPDREAWSDLSIDEKRGYVMGFLDKTTVKVAWKAFPKADVSDPEFANYVLARAWESCLIENKLSSSDIVGFVDNSYATGEHWDKSPWFIVQAKVASICRSHVEAERRRFGLK